MSKLQTHYPTTNPQTHNMFNPIVKGNFSNELHGENVVITSLNTHGAMSNGIYIELLIKIVTFCVCKNIIFIQIYMAFLRTLRSDIEGFIRPTTAWILMIILEFVKVAPRYCGRKVSVVILPPNII